MTGSGTGGASKTTASGTATEAYVPNAINEYTSVAGVAQAHDANGNLTDDGDKVLAWDAFNRLVSASKKGTGAPIGKYEYFPDGRRAKKTVFNPAESGAVEKRVCFFWDGAQEVEEQNAATGQTTATYVWSPVYVDELLCWERTAAHPLGGGTFYAHQDARADVVAITDGAGAVVERRRFDDFGNVEVRDGAGVLLQATGVGLEYWFQGRRLDPETGLYYFRARYYDPGLGRFTSRDPVYDPTNLGNQYTFVGNGPISRVDPFGLQDVGWGDALALDSDVVGKPGHDDLGAWGAALSTVMGETMASIINIPSAVEGLVDRIIRESDQPYSSRPVEIVVGSIAKSVVISPSEQAVESRMAFAEGREQQGREAAVRATVGFLGQVTALGALRRATTQASAV